MKSILFLFSIAFILIVLHSCSNQKSPKDNPLRDIEVIKDHARESVAQTFGTLSRELKATLSAGGVSQAIEYCNLKALALTDSLASIRNVEIKRATDRPRNPINLISFDEKRIFNYYQKAIADDLSYSDTVVIYPNQSVYYAPIRINNLCLKCHGDPDDIEEYSFIKETYPDDQAVGYALDELRGIWCVSYNREFVNN